MTTRPYSELSWTLKWAALWPFCDAFLAKQLPTIVTFHWVDRDLQANTTNKRVLKFLMHLPIHDSLNIISSIDLMTLALSQIYKSNLLSVLFMMRTFMLVTWVSSSVPIPVLCAPVIYTYCDCP